MNSNTKWADYKALELIADADTNPRDRKQSIWSWFGKIGAALAQFLTQGRELKICEIVDWTGQTWWNVYDPATGQFASLASEEELRVWIEQRYYCRVLNNQRSDWASFYLLK